jgi:hypothetical protein
MIIDALLYLLRDVDPSTTIRLDGNDRPVFTEPRSYRLRTGGPLPPERIEALAHHARLDLNAAVAS